MRWSISILEIVIMNITWESLAKMAQDGKVTIKD